MRFATVDESVQETFEAETRFLPSLEQVLAAVVAIKGHSSQ